MARPLTVACLQTRPMPDFRTAAEEALALARQAVDGGATLLGIVTQPLMLRSNTAGLPSS